MLLELSSKINDSFPDIGTGPRTCDAYFRPGEDN